MRIASPGLAVEFLKNPEKLCGTLNTFLIRNFPATASWEFDFRWVSGNGKVFLEVPDEFSLEYMRKQGVEKRLSEAIYDLFRLDTEVRLRIGGDQEARLKKIQ